MTSPVARLRLPARWCDKHLSPAEQRVVELIAAGSPTKAAADQLGKSVLTTRNQLQNAMRKLGVRSRYELISLCYTSQVISRPVENEDYFANAI